MKPPTMFNGTDRKLRSIQQACEDRLGISSQARFIGFTVSLPPTFSVPTMMKTGKRGVLKKCNMKWEFLTPAQQIDYYKEVYIPTVITSYLQNVLVAFEQTKKGMVHMHCCCYDSGIQNDYSMNELRANVRQEFLCMKIAGVNMNRHRVLNYIHFLEDHRKWLDYLQKDIDLNNYPVLLYT